MLANEMIQKWEVTAEYKFWKQYKMRIQIVTNSIMQQQKNQICSFKSPYLDCTRHKLWQNIFRRVQNELKNGSQKKNM